MSPLHSSQSKQGENNDDEKVESEPLKEDTQSEEGSQDESIAVVPKPSSIVLKSEEGITQTSHQVSARDTNPPAQTDQNFKPTHISIELIDEVNPRWCLERLQMIYKRGNFLTEIDQPKRTILVGDMN